MSVYFVLLVLRDTEANGDCGRLIALMVAMVVIWALVPNGMRRRVETS